MSNAVKHSLIVCILVAVVRCGTGIGNGIADPTSPINGTVASPLDLNYSAPIEEYNASNVFDCGSFTEASSVSEVDAGRSCIHQAFEDCSDAKYLYNKKNTDGSRFVSFVRVEKVTSNPATCQLIVHTVSDVLPDPIGDKEKTCSELDPSELPEVACGLR